MSSALTDPNKPADAIVQVNDDGSAVRNDGRELAAANSNPWYVLATIYGEQGEKWDVDLAVKNRVTWNGWVYQNLPVKKQDSFAEDNGFSSEDVNAFAKVDLDDLRDRLRDRLNAPKAELPKITDIYIFTNTYFSKLLSLEKYVFVKNASFRSAVFSGYVDFSSAVFSGDVDFRSAVFSGYAYFRSAIFSRYVDFSSVKFEAKTVFDDAEFQTAVPPFHAAELYDDTTFTLPDDFTQN